MDKFLQFVVNHWILVSLFILAFIWLVSEELKRQGGGQKGLTPQGAIELINKQNAVVIDIRDKNAFESGHITSSVNYPQDVLDTKANKLAKYKENHVIIACNDGQKSVQIMHKLHKQGFTKVFVLNGGLSAWKKADLPLVK